MAHSPNAIICEFVFRAHVACDIYKYLCCGTTTSNNVLFVFEIVSLVPMFNIMVCYKAAELGFILRQILRTSFILHTFEKYIKINGYVNVTSNVREMSFPIKPAGRGVLGVLQHP